MNKKSKFKQKSNKITRSKSMAAYQHAQQLLQDKKEGYVPYDQIFTSRKEISEAFQRVIGGSLLTLAGNSFIWKREIDEALILYGVNEFNEKLKDRGLIELCRFRVPEIWVGVGRFEIDWPETKDQNKDETSFLISLYLFSISTSDWDSLVNDDNASAAYMASLYLKKENAILFDDLTEERFISLA